MLPTSRQGSLGLAYLPILCGHEPDEALSVISPWERQPVLDDVCCLEARRQAALYNRHQPRLSGAGLSDSTEKKQSKYVDVMAAAEQPG